MTPICNMLGTPFPLFAFSHCRDVVAAVSRSGGFGVLGASTFTPEQLEQELAWIDGHVQGMPYGVDLAIPQSSAVSAEETGLTNRDLVARIPPEYLDYANKLLLRYDIDPAMSVPSDDLREVGLLHDTAERLVDVTFRHPVRLVVQALGVPPVFLRDRARSAGVPLGALVGSAAHVKHQLDAGVEVLVAQGTEAGGHCGDVSTMVLVPEIVSAVAGRGVPVLAAGGIATGRQMAAALAMGADGVWTGSVWLTTAESDVPEVVQEKLLAARSSDTIRSRATSGKMCRQLRSAWTDAWNGNGELSPLPMPYQTELGYIVLERAVRSAEHGNRKANELISYLAGQAIGLMTERTSVRSVVMAFMEDFAEASQRMASCLENVASS